MITGIPTQRVKIGLGFLLAAIACASPSPRAAWVNSSCHPVPGRRQARLRSFPRSSRPPRASRTRRRLWTPPAVRRGGTSLALVRGSKLAGVDPVLYPIVLVVSCLDNGGSATTRSRLNFINPITLTGTDGHRSSPRESSSSRSLRRISGVVAAPSNGWAHLVHRPDKGDLLGCGADGSLYSIDYNQTNTVTDGTATKLSTPALGSCGGLAWDAENDTIYQGVSIQREQDRQRGALPRKAPYSLTAQLHHQPFMPRKWLGDLGWCRARVVRRTREQHARHPAPRQEHRR